MVSLETGSVCTPLLPGTADAARWRFTVRAAQFSTRHGSVTAVQTFTVPERVNGEVRALTLSSPDGIDGTVRLTFEAVLAPWEDYVNHPAFARLGFQSVLRRNALLLRRLGRGGKPETWLCAACDQQADFCAEGALPGWLRAGYVQVRVAVHTPPDTPWRVHFALGVGAHEDDAFAAAQRALVLPPESAAALPGTLAAQYGMTNAELEGAMAHISPLLFPTAAPDAAAEQLKRPALWAHGISGDLPVWCARPEAHVLRQWALLRALGIGCDLALCTSDGGDYLQPTRTKVRGALAALDLAHCLDAPGGVHLVPEDAFADVAAAAAIRPGMAHTRCTLPLLPPPGDRRTMPTGSDVHWDADGTVAFTGLPPRAWSNVLTNGRFGFLATDAGTGHLWYRNAHTGRINRWLCDPWVLRGTETLRMTTRAGAVSLFDDDGRARVEYGFGWAAWERTVDGMSVRVTAFVPEDANARVLLIECAGRARITWHTDLVCAGRDADAPAVVTAYSGGVFTAENARADTPLRVCAAAGMPLTGWTCDRFSFLRGQMDRRAGAGLSPCFALEGVVERQGVLVCGCDTRANLLRLTQPDEAVRALHRVRERWLGAVSRLWITTPDEAMNRYLGGWAAYQTLCCRLLARTSLYQNGGAFGFRDQLQDAVNLLLLDSKPAREQIGRACAHQFSAGDVCHWWHAGFGVEHGVRTRISDDLLWLPWAVCEYAQKTGDTQILSAEYPFLAGEELEENEHDRYQPLTPGTETGTVLEHCRRAFMRVLARGVGAHGLLHIGTGDWNDAFDRVGAQGRGESVWLTWFFAVTARKFAALIGGHAAEQFTLAADRCTRAAEAAWDGAWYRRGYYDDGQPLGSEKSGECRIDAIAQAFAAFDTHADPAHVHCALTSAVEQLFDREHNVVRLFDPPITRRTPETGYVRSYGAGLRLRPENGEGAYKTAAYTALANVHARELRSEQMRLLYVALTRAQDKLILTVPLSSGKSAKPFAKAAAFLAAGAGATLHQQANSFADWLRAALLVHPDGGVLRQLSGNRELLFVQTESTMAIKVCDDAVQLSEEIDKDTPDEAPETDSALVETLRQNFAWQYPAAALAQVPAKVSVTSIVHKAEQTTLERPGFLSKDGLTAAEMGTALHAFLEHADFARLAAAKAAGTLDKAIPAERDRQVALQLTAPEIAEKLDAVCIRRFVESEAFAKICAAEQVLRELPFIPALPAGAVLAAQGHEELPAAADAQVLVQGIADLVLVYPDHLELLDYKTDRRKAESDFLRAYRAQLNLYAIAIEKRFAPKKVTYKGIYSFALGKLIEA